MLVKELWLLKITKNNLAKIHCNHIIAIVIVASVLFVRIEIIGVCESEYMDIINRICESLATLNEKETLELVKQALNQGEDPTKILEDGLVAGIRTVGEKFEVFEYFLPDMMLGAEIMTTCSEIVSEFIPKDVSKRKSLVVLGTAAGDIHDIGKNLVSAFLMAGGFEVHDLGVDVPKEMFVEKAIELKADIIGISSLMTTSMPAVEDVMRHLEDTGVRFQFKVLVGGAPITEEYVKSIGADGWSDDASRVAAVARNVLEKL